MTVVRGAVKINNAVIRATKIPIKHTVFNATRIPIYATKNVSDIEDSQGKSIKFDSVCYLKRISFSTNSLIFI